MSLALVTLCLALVADEPLSAEQTAIIGHEQKQAQAEVHAKYGNKKSSELSADERRQMVKDQAAAEKQVLEKNGVSAKQWARESLQKDRAEFAQQKDLEKKLVEKDKQAAAAAQKKDESGKPVEVQRGFSEENPVTLDEKPAEEGKVAVEKQLPPDVGADQAAASEQDRLEKTGGADDAPKSAPKGKGGRRK